MFPMEFDHKVLDSLPLPEKEDIRRVLQILKAIASARVLPYFRKKRVTDATLIARLSSHLTLERMEDEDNRIPIVSLISPRGGHRRILIHERIFDYLAFVIPSNPESRLGGKTVEEAKMLAFAEYLLRHQIEHLLYPQRTEPEIIEADVSFAMEKRDEDPTYYRMLRNALADELNGLRGAPYLNLLDAAEQDRPYDYLIVQIQSAYVITLTDLPGDFLEGIFPVLDTQLKRMLVGEFYQKSRNTRYSLRKRNEFLDAMMRLFAVAVEHDESEARKILHAFKDRWGLLTLFHELDLPDSSLDGKEDEDLFPFFKDHVVMNWKGGPEAPPPSPPEPGLSSPELNPEPQPVKSLKDRMEEARNDPDFPRQAVEVMERNKTSAVGHSGPKYTELIETLLAIPWGKIQKIEVRPKDFEEGLNRTHYGLKRPKEILCDFFSNLIWRYQQPLSEDPDDSHRTGSAFLFVGPPGVGKTSLAISLAKNLNLPYHKISLGGMGDESDLVGHGFTWEGSKPGAVVQGLIKMGVMNGLFIMDEADKTQRFAIATLLEILDPEQNHLFHDKYTQTSVDIDLSRCHFILTANTLETVPPTVVDRCEVIFLDRYGVEEKIAITREHLIERVRQRYRISEKEIAFAPGQEEDLIRHLIRTYTYEAGVRQLERVIRTLFLRLFRKEILMKGRKKTVLIERDTIKEHLDAPTRPWKINDEDRVGETLALGVNLERGIGSIIPIQATRIPFEGNGAGDSAGYLSMVHATGSLEKVMDESRKVATTGIFFCAEDLGIDCEPGNDSIHLHFMGASTPKDGPSAGGAIGLALTSVLTNRPIRRDVAMTGEIDTKGRILPVGGLDIKLETASDAGCKTLIIPKANLHGQGGIGRLPEALKQELQILSYEEWKSDHPPFDPEKHVLQVIAVDHMVQAADIAFVDRADLEALPPLFVRPALSVTELLIETLKSPKTCCCLFYPKEAGELEIEAFHEPFWEHCKCLFLAQPEVKEEILAKHPNMEDKVTFFVLPSKEETFPSFLRDLLQSLSPASGPPVRVSLVAPYFFLLRSGLAPRANTASPPLEDLRLFANNYTVQGFKIKACKPVLNRVLCHLALMTTEDLSTCPFLTRANGIYTMDLSFIPEKYRLDSKRAREILTACLMEWLLTVEERLKTPDDKREDPSTPNAGFPSASRPAPDRTPQRSS